MNNNKINAPDKARPSNKFRVVRSLYKREITDVLRDKKTLVMMVLVPLLLYPLLIIIMSVIMTAMTGTSADKTYKIAFSGVAAADAQALERLIRDEQEAVNLAFVNLERAAAEQELTAQSVHVFITADEAKNYVVNFLSAENDSGIVAEMVMDGLEKYLEELRIERVAASGLDQKEILSPITFETNDRSTTEETMGSVIGGLIPLFMVISIVMSAIYPAIDVTAGEKERGTLETLITLPITNFEMIISKFFAAASVTCVSALLNILSMGVALGFLGGMIMAEAGISDLNLINFLPAMLVTVVVMIFFSLFVTAVSLFVCLFAKSFKEANNYASPVMIVFMLTAYTGMLPDFKLTGVTAGIPVVNVVLMVKQLFQMNYDYGLFGMVLISNVVYSFLMIWLLARVYNSETILFGEGFSGVRIFDKRSEIKGGQLPGYGDVVLLTSAVFLLTFYLGGMAQVKLGVGGVAITQALFVIVPLFYAWYLKSDRKRLFSVKAPQIRHLVGSAVAWAGIYALVMAVSAVLIPLLPESTQKVNDALAVFDGAPLIITWLVIGLMPAVGEELLFRGFVFGALKVKGGLTAAMILSSFIFAVFHMSLVKLPATFILGLVMVWAVSRSGSIFTGMLIHLLNNSLAVLLMKYPKMLDGIPLLGDEKTTVLHVVMLTAIGIAAAVSGVLIIGRNKEKV